MNRFEYLWVTAAFSPTCGLAGEWCVRYVNGEELKDWKKTTLYEFADARGSEAWELLWPPLGFESIRKPARFTFRRLLKG